MVDLEVWIKLAVAYYDKNPDGGSATVKGGMRGVSDFYNKSIKLDGGKAKKYWSKTSDWKPYPAGAEKDAIYKAIDNLVEALRSEGVFNKAMTLLRLGGAIVAIE